MTFHFVDIDNDSLTVTPWAAGGPGPVVGLIVERSNGKSAGCFIPVARVEELVAGIRDAARTASGQQPETESCTCDSAGPAFAPAGHYRDCPQREEPAPAVGQPAEAQAADEARPPRSTWRVEVLDGGNEWTPMGSATNTRTAAEAKRAAADKRYPQWANGDTAERRVVREDTTWTVEDETR
ncbi:hypothetical protein MIU24_32500 [Streptomyces venezuelae]|uniref:hypothetical protein n=1 Tax=Streptomyces sp. B6(2022) TaxID=3404749 RepID=UPI00311D8576